VDAGTAALVKTLERNLKKEENILELLWAYMEKDGFLKSIVDAAGIASISALLERRCWLDEGLRGYLYPNVFMTVVADPGESFKSYTTRTVVDLMKCVQNEGIKVHLVPDEITPAALLKEFQESKRQFTVPSKGTFIQSPLFAHSSEFAVLTQDIGGGSIIKHLLKLYDAEDTFTKRTIHDGKIEIPNPSIVILADTTPNQFKSILSADVAGAGFTSRMIFIHESNRAPGNYLGSPVDPVLRQTLIEKMNQIYSLRGRFKITEGAKAELNEFYTAFRGNAIAYKANYQMKNYLARKDTHVKKLAMIFAVARNQDMIIEAEDVIKAVQYLNDLEPAVIKGFGLDVISKHNEIAARLMTILTKDGVKEGDMLAALMISGVMIMTGTEYETALTSLKMARSIKIVENQEEGRTFYLL
jgi:hypothetical protein